MLKKIVLGFMATSFALIVGIQAFAQTNSEAVLNIYSPELFSPLKFNVNTNDTLNLRVNNESNQNVKFQVPMMDISVEIAKNSKAVVPMSFTNPADKNIWFIIKMAGSNNKNGEFIVTDYKVNVPTSDVNGIDISYLKEIINYDKTFTYEDKPEPVYSEPQATPEATEKPQTGGFVRGYW